MSKTESRQLTSGTGVLGCSLDGWALPADDGVEDAFLLLSLGGEARHLLAVDDGFLSRRVDDSWEDGSAVAAENDWSVMPSSLYFSEDQCAYTADTMPLFV